MDRVNEDLGTWGMDRVKCVLGTQEGSRVRVRDMIKVKVRVKGMRRLKG